MGIFRLSGGVGYEGDDKGYLSTLFLKERGLRASPSLTAGWNFLVTKTVLSRMEAGLQPLYHCELRDLEKFQTKNTFPTWPVPPGPKFLYSNIFSIQQMWDSFGFKEPRSIIIVQTGFLGGFECFRMPLLSTSRTHKLPFCLPEGVRLQILNSGCQQTVQKGFGSRRVSLGDSGKFRGTRKKLRFVKQTHPLCPDGDLCLPLMVWVSGKKKKFFASNLDIQLVGLSFYSLLGWSCVPPHTPSWSGSILSCHHGNWETSLCVCVCV